ncbi:MAG: antibiotic biosynthesis monooxygenase [Spirochaetales bacterium]|nr:antibiotic biosynthesis monooxygenase [Spirochaetales bacterium]
MLINLVYARVKDEHIEAFKAACRENAAASRHEPLVASFDVLQEAAEPARFVLLEAFRDENGPKAHKESVHYKKWREAVAPMMREERRSTRCVDVDFAR